MLTVEQVRWWPGWRGRGELGFRCLWATPPRGHGAGEHRADPSGRQSEPFARRCTPQDRALITLAPLASKQLKESAYLKRYAVKVHAKGRSDRLRPVRPPANTRPTPPVMNKAA